MGYGRRRAARQRRMTFDAGGYGGGGVQPFSLPFQGGAGQGQVLQLDTSRLAAARSDRELEARRQNIDLYKANLGAAREDARWYQSLAKDERTQLRQEARDWTTDAYRRRQEERQAVQDQARLDKETRDAEERQRYADRAAKLAGIDTIGAEEYRRALETGGDANAVLAVTEARKRAVMDEYRLPDTRGQVPATQGQPAPAAQGPIYTNSAQGIVLAPGQTAPQPPLSGWADPNTPEARRLRGEISGTSPTVQQLPAQPATQPAPQPQAPASTAPQPSPGVRPTQYPKVKPKPQTQAQIDAEADRHLTIHHAKGFNISSYAEAKGIPEEVAVSMLSKLATEFMDDAKYQKKSLSRAKAIKGAAEKMGMVPLDVPAGGGGQESALTPPSGVVPGLAPTPSDIASQAAMAATTAAGVPSPLLTATPSPASGWGALTPAQQDKILASGRTQAEWENWMQSQGRR